MTWTASDVTRHDEPFVGDERAMLEGFLDWHRDTLLVKCAGLTGEQLAAQACPPSNLSLLGLVRHMTDVERTWFRIRWGGQTIDRVYARQDRPDAAFEEVDPAHAERDIARLTAEVELARQAVADLPLDTIFVSERWGEMSLRWGLCHMIEEYARHNGHADLIRERVDGRTGA
jgi:uncharacterized damage-inducible protein DinB